VTLHAYDALDRLTQVTYADGLTTNYTYDKGNRLTQVVDSVAGTITRTYDGLDRLTAETAPRGSITYTYDGAGRRATMTVAGQPVVTYTYDNADRLVQLTQGTSSVGFGYDEADRRTSLTLPNGILVEYSYDSASRLTGLTYRLFGSALGTLTYSYDANGRRISQGGTWARTALPAPGAPIYVDAANRLTLWGDQPLSYDANGNLVSDGFRSYSWNARDQLLGIAGPIPASFAYDGLGRRDRRTVGGSSIHFLYDGRNVVQDLVGDTVAATMLTGGVDEVFTRMDGSGTRALLSDGLGSTLALTDLAGVV
jgi:YD repeat-containing protein